MGVFPGAEVRRQQMMWHSCPVSEATESSRSDQQPILVEHADGWATITLNRPHRRNAITGPMAAELRSAIVTLSGDPSIAAIVLRGAEGAFCSGVDLTELQRQPQPNWVPGFSEQWRQTNIAIYECRCPIVVAFDRYGINAGAALAVAGDLIVAGQSSFLQVGEIRQGAPIPMNAAWLRLKAGEAVAARLAYLGDRVSADELLRLALVHQVVPDDQVGTVAETVAAEMAAHPEGASRKIKASLRSKMTIDPEEWFSGGGSSALMTAQKLDS